MTQRHYFIEHPARGVLMQLATESEDGKPHWSWSKPRTEARLFTNLLQARAAIRTLDANCEQGAYVMEVTNLNDDNRVTRFEAIPS